MPENMMGPSTVATAMLLLGEMGMLREFLRLTPGGVALRDPVVEKEVEAAHVGSPMVWTGSDGYCHSTVETMRLMFRAITAVADDGKIDADALRSWLPTPEKLIYIAEHEHVMSYMGTSHPSILCATLYTRLGAWDDAATVVNGILSMPEVADDLHRFGTFMHTP